MWGENHPTEISQKLSITKIELKITYLKSHSNLPGAIELTCKQTNQRNLNYPMIMMFPVSGGVLITSIMNNITKSIQHLLIMIIIFN